jgi:NAD(P)-dependent dehydrogenase (short-subunit alcohol dehydrogenase family)
MSESVAQYEPRLSQLFDLTDRVAIVTGGVGHLGAALCRALAEAGARVFVTSRDAERAASMARTLTNLQTLDHRGIALDHTDEDSINRCVANVIQAAGGIDILVNNAHEATGDDWQTISATDFQRQLANLTGYFLLSRHVRNHAVEQRKAASIVMLGSMYGIVGSYPDVYAGIAAASPAAYHALKGGIVQLTRHLAVYWANDRIRVNCLSPGPFPANSANPQLVERLVAKSPMSRMGEPHELKGALLLLASDAGSYITGQNIIVDGGWTAW